MLGLIIADAWILARERKLQYKRWNISLLPFAVNSWFPLQRKRRIEFMVRGRQIVSGNRRDALDTGSIQVPIKRNSQFTWSKIISLCPSVDRFLFSIYEERRTHSWRMNVITDIYRSSLVHSWFTQRATVSRIRRTIRLHLDFWRSTVSTIGFESDSSVRPIDQSGKD